MLRHQFFKISAILALFIAPPSAAQEAPSVPQITVVGAGQISVVPDIARINIGVREDAPTAAAAMAQMRDAMNKVFDQISEAGVSPADMRTGTIRLNRLYDNSVLSSGSSVSGFEVASTVTVIVRNISDLGPVLDAVVEDGANDVNGLQFDVSDRSPHIQAARTAAVQDARAAADVYAAAAGVAIGDILSIAETTSRGGPVMMEVAEMRSSATPVAAGELTISRSVEIIYALVP